MIIKYVQCTACKGFGVVASSTEITNDSIVDCPECDARGTVEIVEQPMNPIVEQLRTSLSLN